MKKERLSEDRVETMDGRVGPFHYTIKDGEKKLMREGVCDVLVGMGLTYPQGDPRETSKEEAVVVQQTTFHLSHTSCGPEVQILAEQFAEMLREVIPKEHHDRAAVNVAEIIFRVLLGFPTDPDWEPTEEEKRMLATRTGRATRRTGPEEGEDVEELLELLTRAAAKSKVH